MAKVFQRRFPTYFAGFAIGLVAVMLIMQAKKMTAPEFQDVKDERPVVSLAPGGSLRLKLGKEPERYLAWGFPTRLAVGEKGSDGKFTPVITMEYRDLVEEESLIGPLERPGEYELVAQFSVCAYPGEKYCARIQLTQPIFVVEGSGGASEVDLPVDLEKVAVAVSSSKNSGSGSNQ